MVTWPVQVKEDDIIWTETEWTLNFLQWKHPQVAVVALFLVQLYILFFKNVTFVLRKTVKNLAFDLSVIPDFLSPKWGEKYGFQEFLFDVTYDLISSLNIHWFSSDWLTSCRMLSALMFQTDRSKIQSSGIIEMNSNDRAKLCNRGGIGLSQRHKEFVAPSLRITV